MRGIIYYHADVSPAARPFRGTSSGGDWSIRNRHRNAVTRVLSGDDVLLTRLVRLEVHVVISDGQSGEPTFGCDRT
jgi:hypothetical protein